MARIRILVGAGVLLVMVMGAWGVGHGAVDRGVVWIQPIVEPSTPLAEHPAAGMVGVWHGTVNAMGRDGTWHEAVAIERGRWNLAGTAILVEGYGFADDEETGERVVGHDAFGLIEWDDAAGAPVFHAHRAGAEFEAHAIESIEGSDDFSWSMQPGPSVTFRFTISISPVRWTEIGEISNDGGKTWTKFLEMDLERAPAD